MVRRAGAGAVAALLVALLLGCASKNEKITKPKDSLRLKSVTLRMDSGANSNWPARVDLVRVKDAALLPRLAAMKSDGWFGEAGVSFRAAHPDIYIDSWEIVPGTVIGPFNTQLRERVAGMLFCDTQTSPPPLRVGTDGNVVIIVDDNHCRLAEHKPQKTKRRRLGRWGRKPQMERRQP